MRRAASPSAHQHERGSKPSCVCKDLVSDLAALDPTLADTCLGKGRGICLCKDSSAVPERLGTQEGLGSLSPPSRYLKKNNLKRTFTPRALYAAYF